MTPARSSARRSRASRPIAAILAALLLVLGALPAGAAPPAQPVIFGDGLLPAPGSTVAAGGVVIGCTVNSALPVATYSLAVDGTPVPTTIGEAGPPWVLRATPVLRAGTHQASAVVTDSAGQAGGWTWTFTVAGAVPPPAATPTVAPPGPTPAPPPPSGAGPVITPMAPVGGWVVPEGSQRIAVLFGTDKGWQSREVTLDGRALTLHSEGAAAGSELLAATVPVMPGLHTAVATGTDTVGHQSRTAWTFLASGPTNDGALRLAPLAPTPGLTLTSTTGLHLAARLATSATVATTGLLLDGQALQAQTAGRASGVLTITAAAPALAAGAHEVRVQVADTLGHAQAIAWQFYVGVPAPNAARVYFPATGFSVLGPFRAYWASLGAAALPTLGYPISGLLVERLNDGHIYTVQYFERVRLEWHPENAGTPFEVLYGLLGTHFHAPDPAIAAPAPAPGQRFFPETGHLVSGPFLAQWQQGDGVRNYGYPISEALQEVSPTDGRAYLVQYFQRARFEYHPENIGTPYEVLLGMLGRQLYAERYSAP